MNNIWDLFKNKTGWIKYVILNKSQEKFNTNCKKSKFKKKGGKNV